MISIVFKRPFIVIVLVFIISRLVNFSLFFAFDEINGIEYECLSERVISYSSKIDSKYYIQLANSGYSPSQADMEKGATVYAFYPAYPALMRIVSQIFGIQEDLSGIFLSNTFLLLSLFLLRKYCENRGLSKNAVFMAVTLLAFCPENFIFSAIYTESMFLMLSLLALVSFETKRYWLSCFFVGFLSAVRTNGVFIAIFFVFEMLGGVVDVYRRNESVKKYLMDNSSKLLPIVFAPLGIFIFWWICFINVGDAFAQSSTVFAGWDRRLVPPFSSLLDYFQGGFHRKFWTLGSLFYFCVSFLLIRHKWYKDFAYCFANFLLFYSANIPDSLLRYCLVLFPVYAILAALGDKKSIFFILVLGAFLVINAIICIGWLSEHPIAA
ncbi:hypothetical protein MLD52_19905 [Puniceicoccaceae bacterium K14]|nr:hypothetical protein [Puniceicoccaceae bacterium K14]